MIKLDYENTKKYFAKVYMPNLSKDVFEIKKVKEKKKKKKKKYCTIEIRYERFS